MENKKQHTPVIWRGFNLEQWYGSARTAELCIKDRKIGAAQVVLKVSYAAKGVPHYIAQLHTGAATSGEHHGETPESALEAARDALLKLADSFR